MRLEAGLNGQLFQIPLAMQPCLTDTWLSRCWSQCQLLQLSVTNNIQEFEIPRQYDKEIMKMFLQDSVCGADLAAVNWCRMYLQVVFVSEICNGEGTKIDQNYWNGKQAHAQSNYQWPRTSPPTTQEWNLWQQRLTSGLSVGRGQHLPLLLGPWRDTIWMTPGYFMDTTGSYLLELHNQQWYAHAKIPHRRQHQEYHQNGQAITEPINIKDLERATIYKNADRILVTGHGRIAEAGNVPTKEEKFTTEWQIETESIGDTTQLADAFHNR